MVEGENQPSTSNVLAMSETNARLVMLSSGGGLEMIK